MIALLDVAAAVALLGSASAPSCRTADARVEQLIKATVRELDGHEYCQFRQYETLSDVDGDGVDDFLVLFSVEGGHGGGNNTTQVLAAFASTLGWRGVRIEVGWRGKREVRSILRGPGRGIRLETLSYGPADANCCPSIKGTAVLELRDGELRPLKQ